jgi:hypothetical protein
MNILSIKTNEVELDMYEYDDFEIVIRDLIDENTLERYVVETEAEAAQIARNFIDSLFGTIGA